MEVNDLIVNIVWIIILLKKAFQDYIIRNLKTRALCQLLKLWKSLLIFRALTLQINGLFTNLSS